MWIPRLRILTTTVKATEDVAYGTAEATKKTSHATGHAVSKTGHSIEKGASKAADQGEISKLSHTIHRFGAQVGRQFDPSAAYGRGAEVRITCLPAAGKDCL
jgi:hypothetical protein